MTQDEVRAATKKAVKSAKQSGALISFDPNLREPLWSSIRIGKRTDGVRILSMRYFENIR